MANGKKSDLERIRRQLRKLAFGKANDCVKLLDRTKVLEQLAQMADDGDEKAEEFLQALLTGMQDDG